MTLIEALEQMVNDGVVQLSMVGWPAHTMPPIDWNTVSLVTPYPGTGITGIAWYMPHAIKILQANLSRGVTVIELLKYQPKAHITSNATSHAALLAYNDLIHGRLNAAVCTHSWKHYEGIMDEFDFCEKCDEKKR